MDWLPWPTVDNCARDEMLLPVFRSKISEVESQMDDVMARVDGIKSRYDEEGVRLSAWRAGDQENWGGRGRGNAEGEGTKGDGTDREEARGERGGASNETNLYVVLATNPLLVRGANRSRE